MADEFNELSEMAQRGILHKLFSLREEIRGIRNVTADTEMAMRISNNIEAAKEEIERAENLLCRCINSEQLQELLIN